MNTRDDHRFVLLPWEHRGAEFDARPDFVATANVNGFEQLFLLKVRANRVFFRLAEDETRVWGTTGEVEGEAVSFWKRELEAKCIGRLFVERVRLQLHRWGDQTDMAALVDKEGSAWFCEWCSDLWWRAKSPPGLQKYARTHYKSSLWSAGWQPPLRKLWNHNSDGMFERLMPQSERDQTALRWVCGSERELKELLQLFCFAHFDVLSQQTVDNAHSPKWIPATIQFSLRSDSFEGEAELQFDGDWRNTHREILKLFLQHNRVAGVEWKSNWTQEPAAIVRGDWRHSSFVRSFDFVRQPPPQTLRAQARLRLREWLRDKAPGEQIESWLSANANAQNSRFDLSRNFPKGY